MWQPWSKCLTKFATPVAVASMKLTAVEVHTLPHTFLQARLHQQQGQHQHRSHLDRWHP